MLNQKKDLEMRWKDIHSWVVEVIFSSRKGLKLKELLKQARIWEYEEKKVKEEVNLLLKAGRLIKEKGRFFLGEQEKGRVLKRLEAVSGESSQMAVNLEFRVAHKFLAARDGFSGDVIGRRMQ